MKVNNQLGALTQQPILFSVTVLHTLLLSLVIANIHSFVHLSTYFIPSIFLQHYISNTSKICLSVFHVVRFQKYKWCDAPHIMSRICSSYLRITHFLITTFLVWSDLLLLFILYPSLVIILPMQLNSSMSCKLLQNFNT